MVCGVCVFVCVYVFVVGPKYVYIRRGTSVLGASLYFASRMTVAQGRDRHVLTQVKHVLTPGKVCNGSQVIRHDTT